MKRLLLTSFILVGLVVTTIVSCVHKPRTILPDGEFPPEIATIFVNKCATSGCHNAASYENANNVQLDTWEHLFNGGNSGALVAPYSPQFSPLLYFCNTDSTLGPIATPSMPLSTSTRKQAPLTKAEYTTLVNWVAKGAPDKHGNIAFASDAATRQKIYITQQGCDLMAVIDARSKLIMRYISLGYSPQTESPHDVEISSDGKYAYVPLFGSNNVQKIDVTTDQVIGNANMGPVTTGTVGIGGWSLIALSPRDTSIMVSGYNPPGYLINVNTSSMAINNKLSIYTQHTGTLLGPFGYPHGIASNASFDTFITAMQYGNTIMKYTFNSNKGFYNKYFSVDKLMPNITSPSDSFSPNPHQVLMTPDFSKYFVSCQGTNKLVVFDAHTDSILATINVGAVPQEMDIYPARNWLFLACMEDAETTHAGARGSVYVIDYVSMQVVGRIYGDFFQPHDVAVDAQDGLLYVVSTNYSPGGPPPHHVTYCGSRAGWYSVFDLNTWAPVNNKRYEMTFDPYAITARFK